MAARRLQCIDITYNGQKYSIPTIILSDNEIISNLFSLESEEDREEALVEQLLELDDPEELLGQIFNDYVDTKYILNSCKVYEKEAA